MNAFSFMMLIIALFSFKMINKFEVKTHVVEAHKFTKFEYQKFYEHTQSRLPEWQPIFKKYAQKYDLPWTLLAAVAYQESKWDESAESHTGVKGLMQITLSTASFLGISDRQDPIQSIQGGAYYLKYLFSKTPAHLSNNERWSLALAGYNIGWAHIRDAQLLAVQLKHNPHQWSDLKKVIPLLESQKYYSKLNYGYARGKETVQFVNAVIGYYKLLNQSFTQQLLTSRDF